MPKYRNVCDPAFPRDYEVDGELRRDSIHFRDPQTGRGRVRPQGYWTLIPAVKVGSGNARKTWMIAVLDGDQPLPAPRPKLYESEKQAHAVAKSMAEKNRGQTFVVFEATGFTHVPVEFSTEVTRL